MSEKYDNRYVPATTREQEKTTHKEWRLTKSQYLFYYWLIANSCWSNGERHYYIYDNVWTKKEAAEACGVSTKTIERAIPVLEENGILRRSTTAKAYEIYWPYDINVSLNKELLLTLISMNKVLDVETLIKLFSLLLYAHHKHLYTFTIVDLESALGMDTGVPEHVLLMAMLGLLEHWHLL
jgi:Transcriptional regulators of sugar metabolism